MAGAEPFIADLHVHSHFSRATSRDLDLEHLWVWAQRKGIRVIGTGDFTHPGWFAELEDKLAPAGNGLFALRETSALEAEVPGPCRAPVHFMLTVEISSIYKRDGRTRKVHNVVCLPDLEAAASLNRALARIGNLASDGRPILGLDSRDLLEIVLDVAPDRGVLIPAHIWTPWFSAMGSKSGFDSIEACFADLSASIFAVETGLSSDPPMNWRLSALDRYTLVSNSDAHSPAKLAREANLFCCELDYDAIFAALRRPESGFLGTIEFYPEEGKYHLDGHRKCGCRLSPEQTRAGGGLCPVCGKPVGPSGTGPPTRRPSPPWSAWPRWWARSSASAPPQRG
jgi:DNA helicase-2/ATP-dependent DNA helicase PcrA